MQTTELTMREEGWHKCQELLASRDPAFAAACVLRPELVEELNVEGLFFHTDSREFYNAASWEELAGQVGQHTYPPQWTIGHLPRNMQDVAQQIRAMIPEDLLAWGSPDEPDPPVFIASSASRSVGGSWLEMELPTEIATRLQRNDAWERIALLLEARGLEQDATSDGMLVFFPTRDERKPRKP